MGYVYKTDISIGEGAPFGISLRAQAKELGVTLLPSFQLVMFPRFLGLQLSVNFSPPDVVFLEVGEVRMVDPLELGADLLFRHFVEVG